MARKFRAIPNVGNGNSQDVLRALADAVSYVTAQSQTPITPLAASPTNAEIAAKVNELLARLQGTT
jgi:hypothetical protein